MSACPRESSVHVRADRLARYRAVGLERFHAAFGTTISGYLEKRRLEIALKALVNGDAPIGEIALRAGFYDHSHFARVFRRATRLTPSRFREAFGA